MKEEVVACEMARLWTLVSDRRPVLNSGLLPCLVRTFIFTKRNKPSNSYRNKTTATERTQVLKAGLWVQALPLDESIA